VLAEQLYREGIARLGQDTACGERVSDVVGTALLLGEVGGPPVTSVESRVSLMPFCTSS
jgi:hypothetical protein